MSKFTVPKKTFWINTCVPLMSVEVTEEIFNNFIKSVESQYITQKRLESDDENGEFHYIECYDCLNCYGESLGTFCVTHEVNA